MSLFFSVVNLKCACFLVDPCPHFCTRTATYLEVNFVRIPSHLSNEGVGTEGREKEENEMLLIDLPIECWEKFLPANKSLLMSLASNKVRKLMAQGRPQVEIQLSLRLRLGYTADPDAQRKRSAVLGKLGAMAGQYHIVGLDLINFGMTEQDFAQLAPILEGSVSLKRLELAGNDISLGVRSVCGMMGLSSLTTLNLARCNHLLGWAVSLEEILWHFPVLVQLSLEGNRLGRMSGAVDPPPSAQR